MSRKCWIIKEWECYLEDDEINIAVCKLCMDVRLKLLKLSLLERLLKEEDTHEN